VITGISEVVDVSPLLDATAARAKAMSEYIEALGKARSASADASIAEEASKEADKACESAEEKLREYFYENIIHQGISFTGPKGDDWLELPLVGGRIKVFVRGEAEAILMKGFINRRREDIDALVDELGFKQERSLRAFEKMIDESIKWYSAFCESIVALLKARLAEVRYKLEYIGLLQSVLKAGNPDGHGNYGLLPGEFASN
jgi:hypothetical protein